VIALTALCYTYYQSGDEQKLADLWNRCLTKDPITLQRFCRRVLLDGNFDPKGLRIAYADGKLAGCVFAVRRLAAMSGTDLEPEHGWIPWFFVDPDYRGQGIGSVLMQEALQFLHSHGRIHVHFSGYTPNYILPGIDAAAYPLGYRFLLKQGFIVTESPVSMGFSLAGYDIPAEISALKVDRESEGYVFRTLREADIHDTIRFAQTFSADWGRALREALLKGVPMNHILVNRDSAGEMTGFCMYGGYGDEPERFGPFGVSPHIQGAGLGKIMFHECLKAMQAEGLHYVFFLWTDEDSAAGHLYKKAGFQVTRQFQVMTKTL
jgi:mycothiol synthase